MTFDFRIRRIGTLAAGTRPVLRPNTADYAASLSDVATLGMTLSAHPDANGPLDDGDELAVELWDGANWTEPEQGRFTVVGRSWEDLDQTQMVTPDCVEYVSFRLAKALLDSGADRTYQSVTAGYILGGMLDEAQRRGAAAGVTRTFSDTHDSAGRPWGQTVTLDFPADQSLLESLGVLTDAGLIDWTTRGRELVVYARESAGTRHPFTIGQKAVARPVRTAIMDATTSVRLRLDDGQTVVRSGNVPLRDDLGVLEHAITASGTVDAATVDLLAASALADGNRRSEYTVSENAAAMDRIPLVHYELGDWVHLRRTSAQEMRVASVQLRRAADTSLTVDIILADKIADAADKLAKRAKAIGALGGTKQLPSRSSGGGGGGSAREGIVDKAYRAGSGNLAKIDFSGDGSDASGEFRFLASYSPAAGDPVLVLGDMILGRVASHSGDTGENTPIIEMLEPGPGWIPVDDSRYGPLRIVRTTSDWVYLAGALMRDPNYTGDATTICYIPGAYRRESGSMPLAVANEYAYAGGGAGVTVYLDHATGALLDYSGYLDSVSLYGAAWNMQTKNLLTADSGTGGVGSQTTAALDSDGRVSLRNRVNSWYRFPEEYRPSQMTTLASDTSYGLRSTAVSPEGFIVPNYAGDNWAMAETTSWMSKDHEPNWVDLEGLNGYTFHPDEPLQAARLKSGVIVLRGISGGGGVWGGTVAILPEEMRPSYEIVTHNGLRITPSGAIFNGGTGFTVSGEPMQMLQNSYGFTSYATHFVARG